jgi:hypothetical protein
MRQHRPGAAWERRLPASARRPGARTGGRILDLTDSANLPQRDRLRILDVDGQSLVERSPLERPRGTQLPWGGEIVDDFLDGRRFYPEPPLSSRPVDRLGRLLRRTSAPIWLFVLLAGAQACAAAAEIASSGFRFTPAAATLALYAGYACAMTLLPAGVLMWRADAWRSARLVLAGAIAWTALPAAVGLGLRLVRLVPALEDRLGVALALVGGAAAVLACLGPLAIAIGLARVRQTRADWLWPLTWRAGTITALLAASSAGRWLPLAGGRPAGAPGSVEALQVSGSIAGAVQPVELLGLAILACLCLTAIPAEEPQGRLWQCAAAGAGLLFAVGVYEFSAGALVGNLMAGDLEGLGRHAPAAAAGLAAGGGLMLLAFTSVVWSAARDAEGPSRGAPDEVFAWGPSGWGVSQPIPMHAIVAVAAGTDHALALDGRGLVGAWGDNSCGQIDVPDSLSGVVAVAAGDGFSLALKADGTVVSWGANDRGQADVPHGLSGVTSIAAGHGFALALRSDGTAAAWGDTADGAAPAPHDLTGVTAISAGARHALALRMDGTVAAWGDNGYGQVDVPARLPRAKAISAGGDFSLALLADGTVAAWGDNGYGQLDVPEGLANVTAISAGAFHAVALLANGNVLGWGGGLRQGEADHPWRLVDFKAVAAGDGYSLAIRVA